MTLTHTAAPHLLPHFYDHAQQGHVLNSLKIGFLISTGQLCDDDCAAISSKYNFKIIKDGDIIITGQQNSTNGLWKTPLDPKPPPTALNTNNLQNLIYRFIQYKSTKADLAAFLHASLFSPLPSTLIHTIKRMHFPRYHGLTKSLITKHLPK